MAALCVTCGPEAREIWLLLVFVYFSADNFLSGLNYLQSCILKKSENNVTCACR